MKRLAYVVVAISLMVGLVGVMGCGGGTVTPPSGEPTTYALNTTVSPSGAGSISPSGGEYKSGVEVRLTANPASGYSFDYWSGDASGTQSIITVTMDSDKDIVANFHSSVVNPPIQVVLDFFGIKDIHQPPISVAPNRIQLYIVVDDGKTTWNFTYPRNGEGIVMDYFQLEDLRKQTIFQSLSVGDHLTISALAYSCADKEATLSVGKALQTFEPSMGPLLDFYERLPQSRELIGWYEHTWYTTDEWGTVQGRYEEEGRGDLRLWFRIWSNEELAPISKPRFVPDVKILDVTLPTDAKPGSVWIIGSKQYPITLSLMNNEEFDVPIKWEAESSMTGKFDQGEAIVPRNGKQLDITKYYWWEAGDRTITYTIYYSWNNAKLDTWSGTVSVTS